MIKWSMCALRDNLSKAVGIAGFLSLALVANAIHYDEAVDGDLSDDRFSPTSLQLDLGSNLLTATSVRGDREYVHYRLGAGLWLEKVIMKAYSGADPVAFIAVQEGKVFTEPAEDTDPSNLLGYTHFGTAQFAIGDDILKAMGLGFGAIGFTPPLTGENYVFWIQQTGFIKTTYTLDFVVAPEPTTLAALTAGWLLMPKSRRRRR
jgi:hypothetical protein